MSSQTPLNIAIIGLGTIEPRHISAFNAVPSASLACIVNTNPTIAVGATADDCPSFTSIEDMLRDVSLHVDAAIVCTQDHTHVAVSKQLLQAGIHVLCEKPICTDVASGKELVC